MTNPFELALVESHAIRRTQMRGLRGRGLGDVTLGNVDSFMVGLVVGVGSTAALGIGLVVLLGMTR